MNIQAISQSFITQSTPASYTPVSHGSQDLSSTSASFLPLVFQGHVLSYPTVQQPDLPQRAILAPVSSASPWINLPSPPSLSSGQLSPFFLSQGIPSGRQDSSVPPVGPLPLQVPFAPGSFPVPLVPSFPLILPRSFCPRGLRFLSDLSRSRMMRTIPFVLGRTIPSTGPLRLILIRFLPLLRLKTIIRGQTRFTRPFLCPRVIRSRSANKAALETVSPGSKDELPSFPTLPPFEGVTLALQDAIERFRKSVLNPSSDRFLLPKRRPFYHVSGQPPQGTALPLNASLVALYLRSLRVSGRSIYRSTSISPKSLPCTLLLSS